MDLGIFQTIELGTFIDALAKMPADRNVYFDYWLMKPTTIESYRGYYEHLALGFSTVDWPPVTVGQLLENLRAAVGKTFIGWKGGNYRMDRMTPVWADNPGKSNGVRIVDVVDREWAVILRTALDEDER